MIARFALVGCVCLLLGSLSPAAAELPPGLTYDDGYAWFEVKTVRDSKDGKPFAKGFTLISSLRAFGEAPDHSAFKAVLKQGGKTLATYRDEPSAYHFKLPAFNDMPSQLWVPSLRDDKQIVTGEGAFELQVYLVRGDDNSENLLRTHALDIRKVTRVRGNGEADSPEYYVNRHGEAAVGIIYQRPASQDPYIGAGRNMHYDKNVVEVIFGTSPDKDHYNLPRGYLRCTIDGQPLDLSGLQYNDKDTINSLLTPLRYYQVVHTAAGNVKEIVDFRQYMVVLPLTWGKADDKGRDPRKPSLSDHPGKWEVQYVADGAAIRTWRFTVGADGNLAAHPEEGQGLGLGLGPAHLVEMAIPPGGAAVDARLVPAQAKVGGCYGHAWKSPEAIAAAAAIPAKGTPWP